MEAEGRMSTKERAGKEAWSCGQWQEAGVSQSFQGTQKGRLSSEDRVVCDVFYTG